MNFAALCIGAVLMLCFISQLCTTMKHLQTDLAAVTWPKLLVLGAGRRRPAQLSLAEASEGQMELPYGRQESCWLYVNTHTPTHPHTANILSTRSQQRRWVVQHKAWCPDLRPLNFTLCSQQLFFSVLVCRCTCEWAQTGRADWHRWWHTPTLI